jgi:hypothetical protein
MRINGINPSMVTRYPSPQETLAINTDSKEVQLKLTEHVSAKVRVALAEFNPDLFTEVVEILSEDKSSAVRSALARNQNLSEEAQLMIAEQGR